MPDRDAMNLFQVNLFVDDFPTMLRFYRDALGLETTDVQPGPPCVPMVNWASLQAGGVTVELFDGRTFWDTKLLKATNRNAVQLCFIVDDVQRERARLEAEGARCDPIVSEEWGSYASFRDPEGNWLQVYETFAQET
jgi:catechol 2,3-dioxygenase-like lactoylglutathione lyase family enzyme